MLYKYNVNLLSKCLARWRSDGSGSHPTCLRAEQSESKSQHAILEMGYLDTMLFEIESENLHPSCGTPPPLFGIDPKSI